jgi:homoserine kinase
MSIVRAPGSSANLGPGFDVLGVAISRYSFVSDEGPVTGSVQAHAEPCEPDHIARVAHRAMGGTGDVWFGFDLDPGRGMGFSGSARAAGAMLAGLQAGLDIETAQRRAYRVVTELEGHGDNAAPSVFGGIHVVTDNETHRIRAELPGTLLLWVPDSESSTEASRAQLPAVVPLADAVFNVGRASLLMAAIYEGRGDLLRRATQDRLHQERRFAALPDSARACRLALEAGALASWLSGSGPSVAVLIDAASRDSVVASLPPQGRTIPVDVDLDGAVAIVDLD